MSYMRSLISLIFISTTLFMICHCQNYCYLGVGEWCHLTKSTFRSKCVCSSDLICVKNRCQYLPSSLIKPTREFEQTVLDDISPNDKTGNFANFQCLLPLGAVCDKGLGKELSVVCKCLKGLRCKNNVCVADDEMKMVDSKKRNSTHLTNLTGDIRRKDCRLPPGSNCEMPRRSLKEICLCQSGYRCIKGTCTSLTQLAG